MWKQTIDPLGGLALSAGVAALPIVFLFWALAVRRLKGHWAALGALGIAFVVAVAAFRMPVTLALLSSFHGACFGIFPIGWIVFCAVMLHGIMERTGQFESLKHSIAALTTDKRIQAVLVAFCFGALIEACAGFGAPVAISAGILAGLGVPLIEAAELCLVANTAPVAFGAIGIPILMASNVSGIDQMAISQMVGRQLPMLSLIVPFYVVGIMSGLKGIRETWPACLIAGASFGTTQWWTSNYLGPTLPDILSALVSMASVGLWLALRKRGSSSDDTEGSAHHSPLFAWSPFLIVCVLMIVWALPDVKALLDSVTRKVPVWHLHNAIESITTGKPIAAEYTVNFLSAAGTALFISCVITALNQGSSLKDLWRTYVETMVKLKYPLITVGALLAYAYLGNASGMTVTLGTFVARTGTLFALFAPLLGWLGVFITGSDTSSNAIFGKLQAVTAERVGINPVLTVAANASGGVAGKMVSPQSIAVATAATGLTGQEAALFRRTIKHSLILVSVVMVLTYLQSNVLSWMVPVALSAQGAAKAEPNLTRAAAVLAGGVIASLAIAAAARNGKRSNEAKP
jgi:lactate permease